MELQVIRHAFVPDFYRGFCPADHAAALSYQLQRMFESGAAKEGDYFLVRDGKDPYLHVEIYRNNTRRIWEKPPVICPKAIPNRAKSLEALRLVYEFLKNEEYYFSHDDRLEIIVGPDNIMADVMTELNSEFGYKDICSYKIYKLSNGKFPEFSLPAGISFKPFIDLEPEKRFTLVAENDILACGNDNISTEKIYQDHLDDGYFSEELWKIIYQNGEFAGFIMPVFTSGLKNCISLQNYLVTGKDDPDTAKAVVYEVCRTAENNAVARIEFNVKDSDTALSNLLSSSASTSTGSYRRCIIK